MVFDMPKQHSRNKLKTNKPFRFVLIAKRNIGEKVLTQTLYYREKPNMETFAKAISKIDNSIITIDLCYIMETLVFPKNLLPFNIEDSVIHG